MRKMMVATLSETNPLSIFVNPFPNKPFWDRPKFKEAADDNWKLAINPLPHMPILGSSNSAANKDMMS